MKILFVATVQSHICQFHLPIMDMLQQSGYEVHVAARNNLAEKNGLSMKYADKVFEELAKLINIVHSSSDLCCDSV